MIVDPDWYMRSSTSDEVGAWWVRRWAYEFCAKLASEESFEDWARIIAEARESLRAKLIQQAANTSTMACAWFAVDLVETVNFASGFRNRALQYLIRLALTMDEAEAWAGIGKSVHEVHRYKFVSEYIYDFAMGGESARRQRGFLHRRLRQKVRSSIQTLPRSQARCRSMA